MFNLKDWNLEDPCPDKPLSEISPLSLRAWSGLTRSKDNPVFEKGFLNLLGAVDMMMGMDYHHDNFCGIINSLAHLPFHITPKKEMRFLLHETVAYLGRLGQFYHFASSDFVISLVPTWDKIIPTIIKYKRFRDKHSAHRSIDKPRKEDSPHHLQLHALSFSSLGCYLFSPKPGILPESNGYSDFAKRWSEKYLCFQLAGDKDNETLNLSIEREHPVFMGEAYELISRLLSF